MSEATKDKTKLLILTPTLQCGGSEKYVTTVCNNIDNTKFEVTLIVVNNATPFYSINNVAVNIIDLKTANVRNALFKIRNIVKQDEPDIIFSVANHINLLMAMFRWLFPKKIKIIARESSLVSRNIEHAKFPVLYKPLVKRFYNRLDHVICQSAAMQKDLVDNFNVNKNKTTIINNAVEEIAIIDNQLKRPPYQFITVARLSPEKGIDRIIKALSLTKLFYHFHIIGDGNERATLEQLVVTLKLEDKIFFTGQKQQPFSGMENADLFLFGSHYEGFPNAILEAGAFGIPVVAFDSAGINEIITDGKNGSLVKDNELATFAFAIEKAVEINFDRQQIRATTIERFSIKRLGKQLEELLLGL